MLIKDSSGTDLRWVAESNVTSSAGPFDVPIALTSDSSVFQARALAAVVAPADVPLDDGMSLAVVALDAAAPHFVRDQAGPRATVEMPRVVTGTYGDGWWCGTPLVPTDDAVDVVGLAKHAPALRVATEIDFDRDKWYVSSVNPEAAERTSQVLWGTGDAMTAPGSNDMPHSFIANLQRVGGAADERWFLFLSGALVGAAAGSFVGAIQLLPQAVGGRRRRRG